MYEGLYQSYLRRRFLQWAVRTKEVSKDGWRQNYFAACVSARLVIIRQLKRVQSFSRYFNRWRLNMLSRSPR